MKKATKKLFAALMAVLMIVSVFSLSAFAYDRNGKPVKKIVMLGDSIAAGFSLPDYDRRGVYCLQNKRVKGSFGDIVATKLGVTGKNYTLPVSVPKRSASSSRTTMRATSSLRTSSALCPVTRTTIWKS